MARSVGRFGNLVDNPASESGWEFHIDLKEFDHYAFTQYLDYIDADEEEELAYEYSWHDNESGENISGKHFTIDKLGNADWCRTKIMPNNPTLAKQFSAIVRRRIAKYNGEMNPEVSDDDNDDALAIYQSQIYKNDQLLMKENSNPADKPVDDQQKQEKEFLKFDLMELIVYGFIRALFHTYFPSDILLLILKYATARNFVYDSDFDSNGLMHFLGPVQVQISTRWSYADSGKINCLDLEELFAEHPSNAWIMINSGAVKINLTAYTLRNHRSEYYMLSSWRLEGSEDIEPGIY